MSFQAYLDTVKAKTGKTPDDFAKLANQKKLTKHGEIVSWLKSDFGLGHGHANAIVAVLLKSESRKTSSDEKLEKLCSGKRLVWRETCDALIAKLKSFGPDVEANVLVGKKKFAILQPSSAERFDVGIKLKGIAATDRLELAGSWNSMVTHRVRISDPIQVDGEVLAWLKQAYQAA
jgi:Domain of unknown function (DUF4287)/Domain of unknown function (DUF5655)